MIATDVPGCREIVRPHVNGWLVPKGNSYALAEALAEAIGRKNLRVRYGAQSRALVEREFALKDVIEGTIAIYRELLNSHTSASD